MIMTTKKQKIPLKKLTVRNDIEGISCWEFDGKVRSILERLEAYIKEHGEDVYLDFRSDGYESYSDSPGYRLMKDRLETDEEWSARTATERKRLADQEARDLKEYERLKAKFEGKK